MRKNNAVYMIGRIRQKVHMFLEKELANNGINDLVVSQGSILAVLYKHNEPLSMKDIANLIRRDKSTLTYLINKLVEQGYVEKCKCSEDCRVTYITLTDKARSIEGIFREISGRLMTKVYGSLSLEEAEMLESLLEKVYEGFENN